MSDSTNEGGDQQLSGGSYDLLRQRLSDQVTTMVSAAQAVDARRTEAFGSTNLALVDSTRINTPVAALARDIARVGDILIFGYNAELELGAVTPEHVFALYRADGHNLHPLAADDPANFLTEPAFREDFDKLYRFYGKARFADLRVRREQLLAVFQVGDAENDIQVLRWTITANDEVRFLDARGDRDYTFPDAHDIEWNTSTREDQRAGAYPTVAVDNEVFVGFRDGRLQLRVDTGTGDSRVEIDEAVTHSNQSLTDVTVRYAATGDILLIQVALYGEPSRTYVFSRTSHTGTRVDAVGHSSRVLPGGDGIVFCGGYHMSATGTRTFDVDTTNMVLEEVITSPNGEDVLYTYHRRSDGAYLLMPYNLVRREINQVIPCHGVAIFDDGSMVINRNAPQDEEVSVTHPVQWWSTPFSDPNQPVEVAGEHQWAGRVGNAALVGGLGAIYDLERLVLGTSPTRRTWESASAATRRILDTNLWLADPEAGELHGAVQAVAATVSSLIDEFAIRERKRSTAASELTKVESLVREATSKIGGANTPATVVSTMGQLRRARGAVATAADIDQVDTARIEALIEQLDQANATMSEHAVSVLDDDTAFASFHSTIDTLAASIDAATTSTELDEIGTQIDAQAHDLDAVIDTVAALESGDPTVRTRIVRSVSDVTGVLNRARAALDTKRRSLGAAETAAAFDAEVALVEQTMTGSISGTSTPDDCDAVLARLLVTIERLEGRYGDDPERGAELAELRANVHEAVSARRSTLVDERNRRTSRVAEAATRLIATIERRAAEQTDDAGVEAFFATDQMAGRVRELADELDDLGETGRAAEVRAALKGAAENARRRIRDHAALGADDGSVNLGGNRLARNSQPFELVLSARGEGRVAVTVTGTDFERDVTERLAEFDDLLDTTFPSESPDVSRSEYLAWAVIADAEDHGRLGDLVTAAAAPDEVAAWVTSVAEHRHYDGYQRGVHDADAARILAAVASQLGGEPLLRFTARTRAEGLLWWTSLTDEERLQWRGRIRSAMATRTDFGANAPVTTVASEVAAAEYRSTSRSGTLGQAVAEYVVDEIGTHDAFTITDGGTALRTELESAVGAARFTEFVAALAADDDPVRRFELAHDWVAGFVAADEVRRDWALDVDEVAIRLAVPDVATRQVAGARAVTVTGLVADHPRIVDGSLTLRIDALAGGAGARYDAMTVRWPAYQQARSAVLAEVTAEVRLDEYRPKPMAGFVRNTLIDRALLPMFGANLARQIGTVDANDMARQGMLVVVSPPGYGKTTLMEWLADQLGLLIVKVNGPALGHDTVSLDPADAPNATARAEVEKLNLAFALGRNVMLYVDDIQHTSPVLLSRFIPLADATRRIEGVLDGEPHTFDLRGKRFAVVIAGNPYTTGGGRFEMPDMLVNRSDVHNLGDVSSSHAQAFSASYLENSVTANPTLAPHAARLLDDLGGIVQMADGKAAVDSSTLEHNWDTGDLDAAVKVVRHLGQARDVLLKVNAAYIASASTAEGDRTAPPFLLQGSYRNMARLASRVAPVMTDDELNTLVDDHYQAEAQTLTDHAEQNLLAYKELVGHATAADDERWRAIVEAFLARQAAADPATAIVGAIGDLADAVRFPGDGLTPPDPV